ncbi:unnamed protein product [Bursaphelenchus xylophilus]|uniref:Lipase n=2 Tax=Bursaphelenchus xylophilus TaxID=6326 RepID=A0A7I8WS42_BURXY|nr:unnamed protein product [Bursaphelenchus xylophilus]CAG9114928.1 unnamed protein product [Bursaphelenchus xylophilus]
MSMQMLFSLLVVTVVASADLISDLHLPEQDLDALGLIKYWGYQGEEYIVETVDDWLLPMQRIPRAKNEDPNSDISGKPVVILQHGIECASDNFLLNLPHQTPGFVFADAGYDVWLPNSRGNTYSSHKNYTRAQPEFWKWTSDEMQLYDIPAVFDVIENVTGQSSFYYIGHSQGTYLMFAKLSDDPSFASRVKKFFALGPAVQFRDLKGPFKTICETELAFPKAWSDFAWSEFGLGFLSQQNVDLLSLLTCSVPPIQREYCSKVYYWFTGPSTTINVTRMPIFLNHIPAGVNVATVQKYCASTDPVSGGFQWYRFPTAAENIARYGSVDPPYYNLTKMDVPLYLYSCPNDYLTTLANLEHDILPHLKPGILKEDNRYPGYAHMDFIWGLNSTELVYNKIINVINADYN